MLRHASFMVATLLLATTACSTVHVRVPIMRPAEINLRGKSELVIGAIDGPASSEINSMLKDSIVSSGRFKLVDRQHLDKVMQELSLSQSDLASTDSRRKLGKLMTGSIMLVGRVERDDYDEQTSVNKETCSKQVNKKSVQYPCTRRTRAGNANFAVGFDVIDIETGENLKPKRLSCKRSDSKSAVAGPPAAIDGRSLLDSCHREAVTSFMKAIAPWQDFVNAPFLKDGDVPPLEQGINYAQRGEWTDAIEKFRSAVEFVGSKPGLEADIIAKAHWDLGLAYEYTFRFPEAIEEIKKAYDMTSNTQFLAEIDNVKRLQQEQEKLKEQTGEGGES